MEIGRCTICECTDEDNVLFVLQDMTNNIFMWLTCTLCIHNLARTYIFISKSMPDV